MITVKNCLVCGSSVSATILDLQDFPIILRPISNDAMKRVLEKKVPPMMPLRFVMCNDCTHMYLSPKAKKEITDFIYTYLYDSYTSKLTLKIGVEDDNEFLEFFKNKLINKKPNKSRVLEIGCFDGYILYNLKKMGFDVIGCDPSGGAKIAAEHNIPVVQGFYSDSMFPKESFDVVFHRNLLEHIDDPVDFVASTRKTIKENGYLIIETPNGKYYLDKGLIDPFHIEHLSVFTPNSLVRCIENAGLRIEKLFTTTRNLRVICKVSNEDSQLKTDIGDLSDISNTIDNFKVDWQKKIAEVKNILKEILENGYNFALWGTGSFSLKMMSQIPELTGNTDAIVDSDPSKRNLSFYHLNYGKNLEKKENKTVLKIVSPEYLQENPVDYIFILSQFGLEIVKAIEFEYKLSCKKILITPEFKIV